MLDSNGDDDSSSDSQPIDELVEYEKRRLFEMPRNSIYHRCPVKQCTFKTLRSDDNFLSIMDHMKVTGLDFLRNIQIKIISRNLQIRFW